LIFALQQGDDAFVGKFLGPMMLGFYQMAYKISNMPATEISLVISQVSFPAYSKLQKDLVRSGRAYLRVLGVTALFVFPITGFIFLLAPDFTRLFLGERWMPMVPAMQVLCFYGLTRALNATYGAIFQGIGQQSIATKASVAQLILVAILIYPLTANYSIWGTCLAVLIPNFLVYLYLSKKLLATLKIELRAYLKNILAPMAGSVVMVLLLHSVQLPQKGNLNHFLICLASGMVLYSCIIALMDRRLSSNGLSSLKQILQNCR